MILAVSSFFQHPAKYPSISGAPDHLSCGLRIVPLIFVLYVDFSFTKLYNNFSIYLDAFRGGDQLNDRI